MFCAYNSVLTNFFDSFWKCIRGTDFNVKTTVRLRGMLECHGRRMPQTWLKNLNFSLLIRKEPCHEDIRNGSIVASAPNFGTRRPLYWRGKSPRHTLKGWQGGPQSPPFHLSLCGACPSARNIFILRNRTCFLQQAWAREKNHKANIYFNQKCLRNNLIPNYARIKITNTSPASKYTQQKNSTIRIRDGKNKFVSDCQVR